MNLAIHAIQSPSGTVADGFCPRIAARFAFAPGFLVIGGALVALLVAARAPIHVQLCIATFGALLGMWTVRRRMEPGTAGEAAGPDGDAAPPARKTFPEDSRRLASLGDAMLHKARRNRQPLSIAVFDFSDLPELQAVFDAGTASSFGPLIAQRLQLIAPARAVVVRTGPTTFAVLLPNFGDGRARLAIQAALGPGGCIEFDAGNSESLLVPEFATRTVPGDAASIEAVYRQLRTELVHGQRQSERRHAYLKLERESHTRPMRQAASVRLPMAAPVR